MLIQIDPPLIGQPFGLGEADITQLIISARHVGQTLFPISEWPSFVYVSRIVDPAVGESLSFTREQIELVAWAVLFPTFEEAAEFARFA